MTPKSSVLPKSRPARKLRPNIDCLDAKILTCGDLAHADPSPPAELYVSSLPFISATNASGSVKRDTAVDGSPITLDGSEYAKGLGVAAPSRIELGLDGRFSRFTTDMGVDDAVGNRGSVTFEIWADDEKLFDSGTMTGGSTTKSISVDVTGKHLLEMIVTDAGDGRFKDSAAWAGARLSEASTLRVSSQQTDPQAHCEGEGLGGEHGHCHPVDHASHRLAVSDGAWSDPKTWRDGAVPGDTDDVTIPQGVTVTYDSVACHAIKRLVVEGKLQFATDQTTRLIVDTLTVARTGTLEIGTEDNPVASDVSATIAFANYGPIDPGLDPMFIGRGLVSHGTVKVHGATTTPYLSLGAPAFRGDTMLALSSVPENWKAGDRLVIAGNQFGQEEERTIREIKGGLVYIDPLRYDHLPGSEATPIQVANMTRNVIFTSESGEIDSRGHIMFMGRSPVSVGYASFDTLGRTDKRIDVTDPTLDSSGSLVPGTGDNPRGRYAVHFHHYAHDPMAEPGRLFGNALAHSPGWGYVNHSSHVVMEDNFAYNVTGAAFVTEDGDEIGAFRRNLAIKSIGGPPGTDGGAREKSRVGIHDFGHAGHGFWFQGTNVEVTDNFASGQRFAGFSFGVRSGRPTLSIPADRLQDPYLASAYGSGMIPAPHIPITQFRNNTASASNTGLWVLDVMGRAGEVRHNARNMIEGFTAWNVAVGMDLSYTRNLTLRDIRLVNTVPVKRWGGSVGLKVDVKVATPVYAENVEIRGFSNGILSDTQPVHVAGKRTLENEVNIDDPSRLVLIDRLEPRGTTGLTLTPTVPLAISRPSNTFTFRGNVADSLGEYPISVEFRNGPLRVFETRPDGRYFSAAYSFYDRLTGARKFVVLDIKITG
ncbi:NPCBM/NEW2 domain-containing protein [Tautonia sp. JC769]|uniref:NPCBM/NEW2 domain-containing protein n=1 Tax=Tautonia sp. JC769 TaxID=3232135 RepID=UPI0034574B81